MKSILYAFICTAYTCYYTQQFLRFSMLIDTANMESKYLWDHASTSDLWLILSRKTCLEIFSSENLPWNHVRQSWNLSSMTLVRLNLSYLLRFTSGFCGPKPGQVGPKWHKNTARSPTSQLKDCLASAPATALWRTPTPKDSAPVQTSTYRSAPQPSKFQFHLFRAFPATTRLDVNVRATLNPPALSF